MSYTVTTSYYGEQSIVDEYPDIDEAMQAYIDAVWWRLAPSDIGGDIRRITLKNGDKVLRSRSYP
jgi:hypothetical protein